MESRELRMWIFYPTGVRGAAEDKNQVKNSIE